MHQSPVKAVRVLRSCSSGSALKSQSEVEPEPTVTEPAKMKATCQAQLG